MSTSEYWALEHRRVPCQWGRQWTRAAAAPRLGASLHLVVFLHGVVFLVVFHAPLAWSDPEWVVVGTLISLTMCLSLQLQSKAIQIFRELQVCFLGGLPVFLMPEEGCAFPFMLLQL